jgi:acetolactate synthase-1/2/3 large subunit
MALVSGNDLFGRALARQGVDTMFFIMGGPINEALVAAMAQGVRGIDVRHEQAAAMMAQAYARVRARPGVCLGASGPGTINLTTGLANALIDCAPVVAFGGASPMSTFQTGAFQEIDQLALMKPVTKQADRVLETARIPEYVDRAFRQAMSGKPGPVYLDLPGDVLYRQVEEDKVFWPEPAGEMPLARTPADPERIRETIARLASARKPIILSGSGVIWSQAAPELRDFVERTGIPFYTTPQGRGVIPEDHAWCYPQGRSTAFKEADFVLVVGTRLNFVFSHGLPPRFSKNACFARIDIDPTEVQTCQRTDLALVGDAKAVLRQLAAAASGHIDLSHYAAWRDQLAAIESAKAPAAEAKLANDASPIHPLRLCKEIRDFMDRDAILCVDGQEILNYARQTIPSFHAGHRLNSGPFGTMGVGLPFGVGAKAARPDRKVIVLHGDGSFGLNGMELDTAVRHQLPLLVIISLNGGWTADPDRVKPGRELGYTRFDLMAQALGCHGQYVERAEDIRGALQRASAAVDQGRVALVNVVTDWRARATTASFTSFST